MKRLLIALCIVAASALSGCEDRAAQLYDTAQFEELQENREHASELYEEILRRYPESAYAGMARQRLSVLKEEGR